MFEIKIKQFTGPLDKLLELIEARKLDITQINLAEVTADFLQYIKTLTDAEHSLLADFLIVAAKLVLIKSKILLPNLELTQEEEAEIKDLETRLKLYKEFKQISNLINHLWQANKQSFSRPFLYSYQTGPVIFYPPKNLEIQNLIEAAKKILTIIKNFVPEVQKSIKEKIITLSEKIQELINRFQKTAEQSFHQIVAGKSKKEVIISFLAILHLLKDKLILAEQKSQFNDIIIKKI